MSLQGERRGGGWFYAADSLCTPEHGGTRLDAPIHFSKDGKTRQIPLRQLIALQRQARSKLRSARRE